MGKRKHSSAQGGKLWVSQHLLEKRLLALEESVEQLKAGLHYGESIGASTALLEEVTPTAANQRYVRDTTDGWLLVMSNGAKLALPSGLKVLLTGTSAGREQGVVLEGVCINTKFDVSPGNLMPDAMRHSDFGMAVSRRNSSPVDIGGVKYELEVRISYKRSGVIQSAGPFSATTDQTNPIAVGTYDIGIPDFPHDLGAGYGAHGTVWFHILKNGDRYVHPGRVSAGCLTCAPRDWEAIYSIANFARGQDASSIGSLKVA